MIDTFNSFEIDLCVFYLKSLCINKEALIFLLQMEQMHWLLHELPILNALSAASLIDISQQAVLHPPISMVMEWKGSKYSFI